MKVTKKNVQNLAVILEQAIKKVQNQGGKIKSGTFGVFVDYNKGEVRPTAGDCEVCPMGAVALGEHFEPGDFGGTVEILQDKLGLTENQIWNFVFGFDGNSTWVLSGGRKYPVTIFAGQLRPHEKVFYNLGRDFRKRYIDGQDSKVTSWPLD